MTETRGLTEAALVGSPPERWRRRRGGETSMVPEARPQSYYGRPVVKEPVWEPLVAWYLFTGGLGGASLVLASTARHAGDDVLARRALLTGTAALAASPPLLIRDLGRPARFHHMLRVFKPTSPMSVGTWLLTGAGTLAGAAAASEVLGVARSAGRAAETLAAVLGAGVSTYTAVLLSDTSIPAWHAARTELPFIFASSSAASAAAAAAVVTPPEHAGGARRLAVAGAVAELLTSRRVEHRLGEVGEAYTTGDAGRLMRTARRLTAVGAPMVWLGGRRRAAAVLGGLTMLAGAACERHGLFRAGFQSARDPRYTVGPQRRRASTTGSGAVIR